jgi:hypothetical protein
MPKRVIPSVLVRGLVIPATIHLSTKNQQQQQVVPAYGVKILWLKQSIELSLSEPAIETKFPCEEPQCGRMVLHVGRGPYLPLEAVANLLEWLNVHRMNFRVAKLPILLAILIDSTKCQESRLWKRPNGRSETTDRDVSASRSRDSRNEALESQEAVYHPRYYNESNSFFIFLLGLSPQPASASDIL